MSGPKHTPGPWRFYQEPTQAGTEWHVITNEYRTRVIANVPVEPGNAMDKANAHLIAAAPRLAEALKQLLDYTLACELIVYDVEEQHNEHPAVAAARAALREAEGS